MDLHFAEALVSPLQVGKAIARDWELKQINVDRDGGGITYHIGRQDLAIRVQRRDDTRPFYTQTTNLNITLVTDGSVELSRSKEALLNYFVDLLNKNDLKAIPPKPDWTQVESSVERKQKRQDGRSIFYLVPGHLGYTRDITLRALDILTDAKTIFVECVDSLLANLEIWGIDPTGKTLIPVQDDSASSQKLFEQELRALVVAGQNGCFFGCEEGIPGFWDPGHSVVRLAESFGGELEIRTVSAGSALPTSMMRLMLTSKSQRFTFLGLMCATEDAAYFFNCIETLPADRNIPCCFFASSEGLKREWAHLSNVSSHLCGDFALTANLTLENEYCIRRPIREMADFDISTVDDDDKFVVWLQC
jgi:16S rRNA C1402 (ribose-2'-O) methylase RsmI